jgi:E3 ubiquitin-protein ligase TRIP12
MTKVKAKADRAAARLVAASATGLPAPLPSITAAVGVAVASAEDSPAPESQADAQSPPDADGSVSLPSKEPPISRIDLLRSKPDVVGRYMQLMVPILVDVYAASVVSPVRIKSLTGLLKAVSFLDAEELKRVFTVCAFMPPYTSYR